MPIPEQPDPPTQRPSIDDRIRTWLSFLLGSAFVLKFMFWTPVSIDPLLGLLIALLLFGPGILSLWRGGSK